MTDTPGNLEQLTPLQKAVLTIKQLRGRLDSLEQTHAEPIAIVGMGCRFPGGVDTPEAFWRLWCEGVDAAGPMPADRWDVEAYYDPDPATPGKIYPRYGYFLPDVDQFDPHFFGLSPREATSATLLDMACNFAVTVCSKRIFGGASSIHKRRLMR
jgi:beta-ketoacyl synthase-like protein